jgi:pimeloyl-ACP methyl ester carboxylesterase
MWIAMFVLTALVLLPFVLTSLREVYEANQLVTYADTLLNVQSNRVSVQLSGAGPVVVLIHGFGGWHQTWHGLDQALNQAGYRTVTVDMVGAGASSRSMNPDNYTTAAQARTILSVLDTLGIDQAVLIGHSYGGRVALQMSILQPHRISKIIAIAPEVFAEQRPPVAKLVGLPIVGYALAFWSTMPELVPYGLKAVSKRRDWIPEAAELYARPSRVRGHLSAQICQSTAAKDGDMPVPRHFNNIKTPVYVIWGEQDPVFPAKHGLTMVEKMPDAHLAIIPNCGHIPHAEAPSETWEFVRQALAPTPNQ